MWVIACIILTVLVCSIISFRSFVVFRPYTIKTPPPHKEAVEIPELPEKYKTCDWLWNYGSIGLKTKHLDRLNNAINILESLNEHIDVTALKEIKDKLLEAAPDLKFVQVKRDDFEKELKKVEEKPAWSEEDEINRDLVYNALNQVYDMAQNKNLSAWLNNRILFIQTTWKPSDEQMKALLSKLPVVKGSGDKVQAILESLYQDLLKLKGEES